MKYMHSSTLKRWVDAKNNLENDPLYDSAKALKLIELRKKILKACQEQGVGILAGSDAPQVFDVPGFSVMHELIYMQNAGLSVFEVLQTATTNVARFYNIPKGGTIQTGAPAELVLLNSNPLANLKATGDVHSVFANKTYYSPDHIQQRLRMLEGKIVQQ